VARRKTSSRSRWSAVKPTTGNPAATRSASKRLRAGSSPLNSNDRRRRPLSRSDQRCGAVPSGRHSRRRALQRSHLRTPADRAALSNPRGDFDRLAGRITAFQAAQGYQAASMIPLHKFQPHIRICC
jgi:hypothetical protein